MPLVAILAISAILSGTAITAPAEGTERPPNVVVVMTDDQDARTMWTMPKTQRLLGRQGTRFVNAYSSFPSCCPSRATLLTGRYAHNHGVLTNVVRNGGGYPALDHSDILPLWLRQRAPRYRTAHVGRYLNGYGRPAGRPGVRTRAARREVPRGWNRWFAPVIRPFQMYDYTLNQNGRLVDYGSRPRDYQTDVYARHATRLVRNFAGDRRPLFLSFAPLAPHGEHPAPASGPNPRPAPRHRNAYRKRTLPRGPSFNARSAGKPPRVANLAPISREQRREMLRRYRGRIRSLRAVDDAVGRIGRALRNAGELRNTLIVFTSDQGLMLGEHRIRHGKVWPYEEAVRVPLLVRGPGLGVPQDVRRDQVVGNIDLAPTILDAAGLAPDDHGVDGVSLLPLTESGDAWKDRAILLHDLRPNAGWFGAVRAPGLAYIASEARSPFEELYDVVRDRRQLDNLLHPFDPDDPKRIELRQALDELRGCAGAQCRVEP